MKSTSVRLIRLASNEDKIIPPELKDYHKSLIPPKTRPRTRKHPNGTRPKGTNRAHSYAVIYRMQGQQDKMEIYNCSLRAIAEDFADIDGFIISITRIESSYK